MIFQVESFGTHVGHVETNPADGGPYFVPRGFDLRFPPEPLPRGWEARSNPAGLAFYRRRTQERVILSVGLERDGQLWAHVSIVREDRFPTWLELEEIRRLFLGPEQVAFQIHAPASQHVNIHAMCLHLWAPLERNPIPDMRRAGGV